MDERGSNERPRIKLRFKGELPSLHSVWFQIPEEEPRELSNRKKSPGFQWTTAVKALSLFLVDYACHCLNNGVPADFKFAGYRPSAASTLDDALAKDGASVWMMDMFGLAEKKSKADLGEHTFLYYLIRRDNPSGKRGDGCFLLEPDLQHYAALNVEVFVGDVQEGINSLLQMEELSKQLWKQWRGAKNITMKQEKKDSALKTQKNPEALPLDRQRESIANAPIEMSFFSNVVNGKAPAVHKSDLVQFRGRFLKPYLYATLPDENPPPDYVQEEWLDSDCSVVLSNLLENEPLNIILGLFQTDEIGLREWARGRVAKAIWQNLELQETLPLKIAASPRRLKQIWDQECAQFFPKSARDAVANSVRKTEVQNKPEGSLSDGMDII